MSTIKAPASARGGPERREAMTVGHPDSPAGRSRGFDLLPLGMAGAGAMAVAGIAGLLGWRHRRMTALRRAAPSRRAVYRAGEDQLRAQAGREVVDLGELLDTAQIGTAPGARERVRVLMATALDARRAAAQVLGTARGIPDLAGVLVLVDQGLDALAAAQAVADGLAEPPPSPLCFFNPLHGNAAPGTHAWRPIGARRRLRIAACRACTTAIKARETPETLMDGDVPYFAADPKNSVWAETGYGQLRTDLVQRVLRGKFRNGR